MKGLDLASGHNFLNLRPLACPSSSSIQQNIAAAVCNIFPSSQALGWYYHPTRPWGDGTEYTLPPATGKANRKRR